MGRVEVPVDTNSMAMLVDKERISVGRGVCVKEDDRKTTKQRDAAFLAWLRENGAQFDHVDWPCTTEWGTRGAVAVKDIAAGERMIEIPRRLMMSEIHAKTDPELGHVHRANIPVLKSDNGLALYVMQEMLKGERSFYRPYLKILSRPRNLRHWDVEGLRELQDQRLVRRSAARKRHLRGLYVHTMGVLDTQHPGLFPTDQYTFELFDFAWSTIQARAFGKRLSCSALVPLADCLNHGNVQTKYDFNVEDNGMFRLFPSGSTRYPRGAEVLNSYGRRSNDVLLLEYGFAMLDNEWDEVELSCAVAPCDILAGRRRALLRASGQYTSRVFRLRRDFWTTEMLHFNRCACATASELDYLDANRARTDVDLPATATRLTPAGGSPENDGDDDTTRTPPATCNRGKLSTAKRLDLAAKQEMNGSFSAGIGVWQSRQGKAEIGGDVALGNGGFPYQALSPENEMAALKELILSLRDTINAFPTSLGCDEGLLQKVAKDGKTSPDYLNALAYRITAKRVLERQLEMTEIAIGLVKDIAAEEESAKDNSNISGSDTSTASTNTTSAPTTPTSPTPARKHKGGYLGKEILLSGPHAHMYNISPNDDGVILPPSFVSYLTALKNELLLPVTPPASRLQLCKGASNK